MLPSESNLPNLSDLTPCVSSDDEVNDFLLFAKLELSLGDFTSAIYWIQKAIFHSAPHMNGKDAHCRGNKDELIDWIFKELNVDIDESNSVNQDEIFKRLRKNDFALNCFYKECKNSGFCVSKTEFNDLIMKIKS